MTNDEPKVAGRELVYLACPYTDDDPDVRWRRFEAANRYARALMRRGWLVFSPISHSQPIFGAGQGTAWATWEEFDLRILAVCDRLFVLRMPGWETSVGVNAEIAAMNELGRPVAYIKFDPSPLWPNPDPRPGESEL